MQKVFGARIRIVTLSPRQSKLRRFLRRCKAAIFSRPLYDLEHPDPHKLLLAFSGVDGAYYNPVPILISGIIHRCKGMQIVKLPPQPGKYDYLEKVFEQGPKGSRLRSALLIKIEGDEAYLRLYFYDPDKFRSIFC